MRKLTPKRTRSAHGLEHALRQAYRLLPSGSTRRWTLLVGGGCMLCACDTTTGSRGEPASVEQTQSLRPASPEQDRSSGEPGTPQTVHATPETAVDERPSVDENMGRGFQGTLALRLRAPSGERTLRYQTRGNRARLQVDGPNGAAAQAPSQARPSGASLDALIWEQSLSFLNHEQKTYRTVALDDVKARDEPGADVKIQKTGERINLAGVTCERYQITQGELAVSACVSAIPGSFDVDKFEASSRVDVPPWAERLLGDDLLPLQAKVTDAGGRELYSLELIEYSAGPVDEAMLALPPNYRAESAGGASEVVPR
jgi:hypothetical protein